MALLSECCADCICDIPGLGTIAKRCYEFGHPDVETWCWEDVTHFCNYKSSEKTCGGPPEFRPPGPNVPPWLKGRDCDGEAGSFSIYDFDSTDCENPNA